MTAHFVVDRHHEQQPDSLTSTLSTSMSSPPHSNHSRIPFSRHTSSSTSSTSSSCSSESGVTWADAESSTDPTAVVYRYHQQRKQQQTDFVTTTTMPPTTETTNAINISDDDNDNDGGDVDQRNTTASVFPLRSYGKWCPAKQGATLVWRDVCVYATRTPAEAQSLRRTQRTLNASTSGAAFDGGLNRSRQSANAGRSGDNGGQLKRIINNATGAIQAGTLMALMGSSGAGKSTLMSALAYRNHTNTIVQGDILLNGRPVGPYMHRLSGFVHQDDLFVGTLTVREHLTFAAHFRLDRRTTAARRRRLIADLLHRTGLTSCAGRRIGDGAADDGSGSGGGGGKMLSGGERKRLAFATELLNRPTMLFCDEPTTGLDSYSAQQLVRTLQLLARRGTTIMCTIHQPSSQLFAMFHQVLLLADGRVAFCGEPTDAIRFFAANGHHCPAAYNPADFLVGVLATAPGCERASQRTAQRLCDLFAVSETAQQRDVLVNLEMHMAEECGGGASMSDDDDEADNAKNGGRFRRPFWFSTLFWLTYRLMLATAREPTIIALRMGQKVAIALMAGLCFYGSIDLTQYGVQALQGALFLIVSENTFSPMYAVLAVFPQAFPMFVREKQSGNYDTVQFYVAHLLAMLPIFIMEPLLFCVVCYWLAGLRTTAYAFGMTTLVSVLVINVAAACGTFFSAAFNSVPLAMAYLVPFDYILMITSGVFVRLSSITPWLSWLQYMSWFMYANEAMSIVQWHGVENITCFTTTEIAMLERNAADIDRLPCLRTGAEVLEQYDFSGDNLQRDIWSLVGLYVVFNVLALFCLWRRVKKIT